MLQVIAGPFVAGGSGCDTLVVIDEPGGPIGPACSVVGVGFFWPTKKNHVKNLSFDLRKLQVGQSKLALFSETDILKFSSFLQII